MDLGTIWASVGLKTAPLEAGVIKAKGMMSGLDASLSTGKLKGAETGLASLGTKLKNLAGLGGGASSALGGVGASIGTLGEIGIAVGAVAGLGAAMFSCAKEAAEVQKVTAQTEAVIASTGGVANVTAAHVEQLGGKLRDLSGIDDEVIKTGANILLTFRGIQNQTGKNNDIFDQATAATLDLSVAMGRDMSKSAIMVGKALQDPVRGLTAMRRVGVQFTASQEEMIKSMVASGNTIGAQKIILAELNAEFGKSAEAYGRTLPGQIGKLKSAFGDLKESIGKQALAPAIAGVEQLTMAFKGLEQAQKLSTGNMIKSLTGVKTEAPGLFDGIWSGIQKIRGVWREAFPTDIKAPIINKAGFIDFAGVIEGLTGKFSNLRSMMDSVFAQMGESSKELADTLGVYGLKGVMEPQIKDVLDSLISAQPRMRKVGNDMMKQLVDSVAMSDPIIKENASKIGDDISMALEQALEVGPVTDKQMAGIALSIIKQYAPTSAAAQTLMDRLQGIINGTPLVITPEVKIDKFKTPTDMFKDIMSGQTAEVNAKVNVETAQASQNVTGLKANIAEVKDKGVTASTETAQASQNVTGLRNNIALLQNKTVTITVLTGHASAFTPMEPPEIGKWMADGIAAGYKGAAKPMQAAAGIGGASAALTSTFGSFIKEMNAAPILEVENAINALTTADWGLINAQQAGDRAFNTRQKQLEQQALTAEVNGNKDEAERVRGAAAAEAKVHDLDMINRELNATNKTNEASIAIWRNANAAYEQATAGLTNYETRLKTAQTAIDKYNVSLQASETRASKAQAALDKLSSMKFTGEGAAADKAYEMDEKSKNLQLQIMQAEDAHNYALAAQLTLQKEANDREKEKADLQSAVDDETGSSLDDQHRKLEKLLDPLKGQEKSYKEIAKQITAAQATLAKEARIQSSIKIHIDQQTKSMKLLQYQYNVAKVKVDAFKKQIDDLASFFVSKYRDMGNAVTGLNNAIGGGGTIPSYQAGISYVPATGLAVVHKGEQITPALRPIQMHTTSDTQVTIPLYLDGKVLAKTVTKIQGGNASAYAMSGGKY